VTDPSPAPPSQTPTALAAPGRHAAIDYERLASEVLRALRGKRSQVAWSRRLGGRGNLAYSWESGRRFPTAARAFWAMARAGIDVRQALVGFYHSPPEWLADVKLDTPEGVTTMLSDLRGHLPLGELAQRTQKSRFSVSRWLSGRAEPRLPDLLRLVDAMSLRVLDFVHALVGAQQLPSVRQAWQELNLARTVAHEMPWSHAVLRALELAQYQALPAHPEGWLATRLGISAEEEQRCLEMLERTGQLTRAGAQLLPAAAPVVDTRQSPEAGKRLKHFWTEVALDRIEKEREGLYSFNLFTVSEQDYQRLRELHLAYFRQLRSIVANSSPAERVVVANVQLFTLCQ
jgi:DNA-binding phage protein/DNA-binding Lrp family transcriptional regulator